MSEPLASVESTVDAQGHTVLRLSGEVDMSNANGLSRRLREASAHSPAVVVDLAPVTYLDSQGLLMLLRLVDHVTSDGREVTLLAPREGVAGQVIGLACMEDLLHVQHP
jgi:anti-anti-sigma factor